MKSFHNILLFSDVDGTIAWSSEYINPKNFDAIRYFINHGGHFAFSSGRNHKDIFHILPNLKELVNMPCILCNGSYLYDANTGDILNPQYLDSAHAVKLLREVNHDFPDVGFRVTVRGGFLVPSGNETILRQLSEWGISDLSTICDITEFDGCQWFKAVFIAKPPTLLQVAEYIEKNYSDYFTLTRSSNFSLELQPLGVSKSFPFPFFRSQYPGAVLYAIGDFDNDAEMLRAADVAACPENASEEIKKIASIHVCHCKDGAIAELIEKIKEK